MAKVRIGHFVEAQALESLGVDMIDESEVLTPADPFFHVDKRVFTIPFVCGCRNLGEAVRRIWEGAAMIRTKGEAGTGNIIEAVRHQRMVTTMIHTLKTTNDADIQKLATAYATNYADALQKLSEKQPQDTTLLFEKYAWRDVLQEIADILKEIKTMQRLPVVNFAAGGIATPADAALMMQLGSDGVFVGSGIFKSSDPEKRAKAIVEAVAQYEDPDVIAKVSRSLGEPMSGLTIESIPPEEIMQDRGW
jgi:pyridoxal 5'-phosphate synthase pdxS subunit